MTAEAAPQVSSNVNARYVVESVDVQPEKSSAPALSRRLRTDLKKVVGTHLNPSLMDSLRERIRIETGATSVLQSLARGSQPEMVRVIFQVKDQPNRRFDVQVPKFTYHSAQGWSGAVEGLVSVGGYQGTFGVVNDGDELVERFAGLRGGVETRQFKDRVTLRMDVEDLRAQWHDSTLATIGPGGEGIYRLRRVFQPMVSVRVAGPLTYSAGVSFQNLQMQFPAARTEAAHAVLQTLRLTRRWRDSDVQQQIDAGYSLRAATKTLASDFAYSRHQFEAGYELAYGRHGLEFRFTGGTLGGTAPLFERFVAGNTSVLRGWNKFEITPAGARRLAAGSTTYRFRSCHVFYDVGSAWNPGEVSTVRQSLGFGFHAKRGPFVSVAFPLRDGGVTPVFLLGMNF